MLTGMLLPWVAILVLEAPAAPIALLATFRFLPHLLFGLVAGTWADRLPRRPLMIAADLVRAALVALIPALWAIDLLSVPALYAVVFASASFSVLFEVAERAYLPSLVERGALIEGNSKLAGGAAAAEAAGFAASGWLAKLLTPPFALLVDAATYVASALVPARIRVPERVVAASEYHTLREIRDGLREIRRVRPLLAIAWGQGLLGVANGLLMALYMIYVLRVLGFGVAAIGVIAATGSVGSLTGAWLAPRLARRLGVGPAMITGLIAAGFGIAAGLTQLLGPLRALRRIPGPG